MTDATEKLVDDILRIGADRADPAPEPVKAARIYQKSCVLCGADFAAKSPAALYCPDCVQKRRIDGGRKSAEKAKSLREPDGTDREAEKQKRARQIEDAVHKLEAVQPEKDAKPGARELEADVEVLADMEAQICRRTRPDLRAARRGRRGPAALQGRARADRQRNQGGRK